MGHFEEGWYDSCLCVCVFNLCQYLSQKCVFVFSLFSPPPPPHSVYPVFCIGHHRLCVICLFLL